MKTRLKPFAPIAAALSAALFFVPSASANLIVNGDFEMVDSRVGMVRGKALDGLAAGRWDVFSSLPGGWYASSGAGIEVQYNGTVVNAQSGRHYVELDSHGGRWTNSSMSIDLTLSGGDYVLDFMYQPRTTALGDNGIRALLDGNVIGFADGERTAVTDWQNFSFGINGLGAGLHTLTLEAFGTQNTLGGLVDNVRLAASAVPEPSAGLVFGLGMGVVAASRRRAQPRR